jgi:hypothetical protein
MSAIDSFSYPDITFTSQTLGVPVRAFYEAIADTSDAGPEFEFYLMGLTPQAIPGWDLMDHLTPATVALVEREAQAAVLARVPEPDVVECWELEDLPF